MIGKNRSNQRFETDAQKQRTDQGFRAQVLCLRMQSSLKDTSKLLKSPLGFWEAFFIACYVSFLLS